MIPTYVTRENFIAVKSYLLSAPYFALDTETTGVEWSDRPFVASLAALDKVFICEDLSLLSGLFAEPCTVIMANAKFDMRMLGVPQCSTWNIRDICIFERILWNCGISLADYSLDAIAKRRLGESKMDEVKLYVQEHKLYETRTTKYTAESYTSPRYDKVPRDLLHKYAALDASLTLRAYEAQLRGADEHDMRVFENECKLLHVTYKMEMDGIRLDEATARAAIQEEKTRLQSAIDDFYTKTNIQYSNKKSVLIPLFEKAGEKIVYTLKGNPRLTDEDLEGYRSEAAKCVQKIRYHEKRISTYFSSYLDLVDDDGYIHPNIQQHGTKTGRFSYSNPNLQNCTKKEPESNKYTVRGCFVPEEGNVFVSLDYSQQEYRVMLDYAGERKVIEDIMKGKDVHQAIADMAGIDRTRAKQLAFGILYNAGVDKVSEMLDISFYEAKRLRSNFLLSLPNVDKLISDISDTCKHRGYVYNWFGRKLRNTIQECYRAPNHVIQGGCGDIIKIAMVRIHNYIQENKLEIKIRIQVHDELVLEGSLDTMKAHVKPIRDIMSSVYPAKNGIVLTTSASYSEKSFAERDMKKWEF